MIAISGTTANIAGFAGMACIVLAYAYMTWHRTPNPFVLHGTNLAGAALLTVSLLVHTNPASLTLEGFWAAIAIWGLVKAARERSKASREKVGTKFSHQAMRQQEDKS